MKITRTQLRNMIREEVRRMRKEGYEHITKNMGYVKDQTEPSEYTKDGADILASQIENKLEEITKKLKMTELRLSSNKKK